MSGLIVQKADRESLETLSRFCMRLFSKGFHLEGQEKGIQTLLMECLHVDNLYMAQKDGVIRGAFAISDGKQRAVTGTAGQFRKALGIVIGSVAYPVIRKEMMDEIPLHGQHTVIEWLLAENADEAVLNACMDYIKQNIPGPYLLFSFDTAMDSFLMNSGFVKTATHTIAPGMEKRVFEG